MQHHACFHPCGGWPLITAKLPTYRGRHPLLIWLSYGIRKALEFAFNHYHHCIIVFTSTS